MNETEVYRKNGKIYIVIPENAVPVKSKSGKAWILASQSFRDTNLKYLGVPVSLTLTLCVSAKKLLAKGIADPTAGKTAA